MHFWHNLWETLRFPNKIVKTQCSRRIFQTQKKQILQKFFENKI